MVFDGDKPCNMTEDGAVGHPQFFPIDIAHFCSGLERLCINTIIRDFTPPALEDGLSKRVNTSLLRARKKSLSYFSRWMRGNRKGDLAQPRIEIF